MPQLTQEQQAAIRAINQASALLDQAVTEARKALNASIFIEKPDRLDIKAKAEELAAAELARALARAEAFAKLQASPSRINLPPQSLMMPWIRAGAAGQADLAVLALLRAAPAVQTAIAPPVEGGFDTSFVSPMFGDNMVLQRGKPNTIWGWAKPGEEVRVTIARKHGEDSDQGRWSLVRRDPASRAGWTIHHRH